MPEVSKRLVLELQKMMEEKSGRKISFEEVSEAARHLVGFFDLLWKIDQRNKQRGKNV